MFWRRSMTIYSFESDVYNTGEIYDVRAYMCSNDKEWANKNPLIAQMLLKSKIKALKKRDDE